MRETCAQTLGSVLHYMNDDSVAKVLKVLLTLQEQDLWQVRHGGHLGIKYVLALKKVDSDICTKSSCYCIAFLIT